MTKGKVTILGSNGHLGHAAMQAFRDAGWTVTGLARTNRKPVSGTRFIAGDADEIANVRAAIADADVVVNGLHLPYDQWGNGRAERQLQVVINAMAERGGTLMFPGTIYNYRAKDRVVSPSLRQDAEAPRGEIRIRLERLLADAAKAGKFQSIIVRAGDFFGPDNRGDWYDQAMLMDYTKGRIYHLGDLDMRHSWAYLPDLGRAFAVLAERRGELAGNENLHFAGHYVPHRQIMQAIRATTGKNLAIRPMPWWLLGAIGLVNPVMRDVYRMRYLWQNEMELTDPRLDALLGENAITPIEEAVGASIAGVLAERRAA